VADAVDPAKYSNEGARLESVLDLVLGDARLAQLGTSDDPVRPPGDQAYLFLHRVQLCGHWPHK
jgi:hypothetical protein